MQPTEGVSGALVDWLSWTVHGVTAAEVCAWLGGEWAQLDHGAFGYRVQHRRGALSVLSEGSEAMGVHVVLSGQACREVEATGLSPRATAELGGSFSWPALLARVGPGVTRIDVALDDREGVISMDAVDAALREGEVVSRGRAYEFIRGYRARPRAEARIGRRSSETFLRIYDKALERRVPGPWVRVELELKGKRAVALAARIAADGSLGMVAGLIRGHLRFVERSERDGNSWRWRTAEWWGRFLAWAQVQRLAMAPRPPVRAVDRAAWLERQAGPSLAIVAAVWGIAGLLDLVEDGERRLRLPHRLAIAEARAA